MKASFTKAIIRGVIFFFLLTFPTFLHAQDGDVIQSTSEGGINWTKGTVFARGEGFAPQNMPSAQRRAMAYRAAVVTAQRNLLEITKGVRIDSETIVKDAMVESDIIKSKVEGFVKGAQVIERNCRPDGSCEVLMGMNLSGGFLGAVVPKNLYSSFSTPRKLLRSLYGMFVPSAHAALKNRYSKEELETLKKILDEAGSTGKNEVFLSDLESVISDLEKTDDVTGILIDASGVPEFDLAVSPVIKTANGVEVYPGNFIEYEDAMRLRPVTYKLSVEGAINDKRIFNIPFQTKALGVYKKKFSDLIVSQEDAEKIMQYGKDTNLLKQCKVVIVVGQ